MGGHTGAGHAPGFSPGRFREGSPVGWEPPCPALGSAGRVGVGGSRGFPRGVTRLARPPFVALYLPGSGARARGAESRAALCGRTRARRRQMYTVPRPTPARTMRAPERRGQPLSHRPWALPALLLALALRGAADTPTFPWRDTATQEWLTCAQCPPGTFVKRPCRRDQPTTCDACPPRHYTQFWNYLERCRYCNVICGEQEEEARPCSATHNRACRCRPGFFAHSGFCLEHKLCPPGTGVAAPGTPSQNTQCQPCPAGTFSASSSSSEECRPHRNCTALGLALNVPGSSSWDAQCTSCAGFPLGPGEPGTEECDLAVIDFVAFQDISFKRLQRLQQALGGPGDQGLSPSREGRAALQVKLRRRLSELRGARDVPLLLQLLAALRSAGLPGLERSIRARFLPAG